MKARHILLAAALVAAASLAFFGDKTPEPDITEPVIRASSAPAVMGSAHSEQGDAAEQAAKAGREPDILALQSRETLIAGAGNGQPADGLFISQSWTPPPPPPPKPLPPPPPTAPPLPFAYLGKKAEDGIWEVYLARGDQTFIVREQTVIDGTYRVDSVKPPTISLTYLPLNQMQTFAIGGTD